MKIEQVRLRNFKRFTDLTVANIPVSAKLVVLVGPNGSGKTSLLDALNHWHRLNAFRDRQGQDYFDKSPDLHAPGVNWYENKVALKFHDRVKFTKEELKGRFYFRSAYRNEPDFTVSRLARQADPRDSSRLSNLMQNDQAVSENYQRLVSQTLAEVYNADNNEKTVQVLREELIGKIRTSLAEVFDDLALSSIGDPLANGSFFFEKGTASGFHYKNLSAGEKSVFDLLTDMVIKGSYFTEAVYCIDEPEAHMHTSLQAKVLRELYALTPGDSQLWISTHSIGMLSEAELLSRREAETVVFLDFSGRDFDQVEVMQPTELNRTIWERFYSLAFGELSNLIAPRRVVFCEGTPAGRKYKDFDSQIYSAIFRETYHDTSFISVGSCEDIERIESDPERIVAQLLTASELIKVTDRDDKSPEEVKELLEKGIRTLKRRHLECYLLDDFLIGKLCKANGKPELEAECLAAKQAAMQDSVSRGNPADDVKSASGPIITSLKRILELAECGNNTSAFLRDTMVPLITSDTVVFKELEAEILG